MKLFRAVNIVNFIILVSISSYAEKNLATEKPEKSTVRKITKSEKRKEKIIAIFPFYDYSESGMKYLSSYIPEMIKEKLKEMKNMEVIIVDTSMPELKNIKTDALQLYDAKRAIEILSGLDVDILLLGRYIVQGKIVRIDYMALLKDKGKRVKGDTSDLVKDDNFFNALDKFANTINIWIKTYIVKDDLFRFDEKKENILVKFYKSVRDSKFGIVVKNRWIFSILILILFLLLSKILMVFFEKVLKRITQRTSIVMDEQIVDITKRPAKWIVVFIGIKLAIISLGLSASVNNILLNITTGFIIIFVTYIISSILEILIQSWGKSIASRINSRIDDDLIPLFVKIMKIIVLSIGGIMVLSRFNVDIAPLIASLGIAGFAIGFAVKDSLSNVIGGIVLILDQSFAVGDKVTIDGDTGIIKEVGLRNTKIQTYDNEIIVIPNGDLMNKKFKNSVLPDPKIRVVVKFSVAYGTDVDEVEKVVLEAIKTIDDITDDPAPAVVFTEMGDFSLNFEAKFWVPDYINQYVKWIEGNKIVYKALNDANISIPFPTHTVYIEKDE